MRSFVAGQPGTTQVQATFGNLSEVAEVTVIPDRYRAIYSKLVMGGKSFHLDLDVRSSPSDAQLEYRVVQPATEEASDWTPAVRLGDDMSAKLSASA